MKTPAVILASIQTDFGRKHIGGRFTLLGVNPYIKSKFKDILTSYTTSIHEVHVEADDVHESSLRIRDTLLTHPFHWEQPLLWIEGADHLFTNMSFPEDFPVSRYLIVCCSDTEEVYVPTSFVSVAITVKGAGTPRQDMIRWMLVRKDLSADIEVIRFLAAEYKEDLAPLEKLIDLLSIRIHPRTFLMMKDLEAESDNEWDCELLLKAIMEGDESKSLSVLNQALRTFHPKGIVTILIRRISLLIQVASSATDQSIGDVKPWVWRNNQELVKDIPSIRLFQWAASLDKTQSILIKGCISPRWAVVNLLFEMSRK